LIVLISICFIVVHADASALSAQHPDSAVLTGKILDPSGAVVPAASIDLVAAGITVATTTSGTDGQYRLEPVPRGPYELRVRREGFAEQVVRMRGSESAVTRDITLQVGGISDTLVVTASRGAESRSDLTQAVSVVTAADIQALGSTSLADAVRFVPGLAVEGTGREGALTSLFSRGGDSDYNVVLIDGVRANLDGGRFDFSRIASSEIDRVEVVRGAQSALWGADAMGAVVQVFTNRARATDPVRIDGSLEGGSFNTWRGGFRLSGGARNRLDYQIGFTHRRSDGAFSDILSEKDRFEQKALDGGVGFTIGSRASVRTGLRYSQAEGRSPGPIAYGSRDTGSSYDTEDLTLYATLAHAIGQRFTGSGSFNYFRNRSTSADNVLDAPFSTYAILQGTPNAIFPNGSRLVRLIGQTELNQLVAAGATPAPGQFLASRTTADFTFNSPCVAPSCPAMFRRPAIRYQGDYWWAKGQRLSAGYEWEREVSPLVTGFDLDNYALFIHQQSTFAERWFLTLGIRVDNKESYSTFVSPKLSLGGYLLPFNSGSVSSVKAFGNLGKGVKSATFAERFGGSFADPNPGIKVERARSADIGVEATFVDQRFRSVITYFYNKFLDQISFRSGVVGDGVPEYINIDGSKAHGWEVEASMQKPLAGFTGAATYAMVNTEVVTNQSTSQQFQPGQPLLRRPKNSGTFRMAYAAGLVTVDLNARLVGDRHDNSFLSLRTIPNAGRPAAMTTDITVNPGYTVFGLGVSVRANPSMSVFVRGDNLTDTQWESALGYPGLPRAIVAGIRFNARVER